MLRQIEITEKQAEYIRNAHHRWNFAVGAVRSGKSHIAVQYVIPEALTRMRGLKGINLILGATRENIERNVLIPMRQIWGDALVGEIRQTTGIAMLFGEKVYCMGAESKDTAQKIRGSEVKFCYCDEICDIHVEVFDMLKSRLSLEYSECHLACNPKGPNHYVKRFIDTEGLDMFYQHYTIYDNPFLSRSYVKSLEMEYAGTVYYKRYIEGLWTQAEGLIYPNYDEALEDTYRGEVTKWVVSCDYGTQNPFCALKWARDPEGVWHCVEEYYYCGRDTGHQKTDEDYADDMEDFCDGLGRVEFIVDPSATSFIAAMIRRHRFKMLKADNAVLDGIRETSVCMQKGYVRLSKGCNRLFEELAAYSWKDGVEADVPVKENDHACDALRYFVKTKHVYKPRVNYRSVFDVGNSRPSMFDTRRW